MSFKHNPVDEALSASKSLKILETTPTGADFDARVRITVQASGVDVSIDEDPKSELEPVFRDRDEPGSAP